MARIDEKTVSRYAYICALTVMGFSTLSNLYFQAQYGGLFITKTIWVMVAVALAVWVLTACYRGSRLAAAIVSGMATIELLGIATLLFPSFKLEKKFVEPMDILSWSLSAGIWLTLGVITLRRTKAAFLAGKNKPDN